MKSLEQAYQNALNRLSRRQSVSAQVSALVELLIEKRVFTQGEWQRAVIREAEHINKGSAQFIEVIEKERKG